MIYTRCKPRIDLKNGGQITQDEGFGVPAVSENLIKNSPLNSYDYLSAVLSRPNGAKEDMPTGLFNSYEYVELAPNVYSIIYEVARPHCKVPRVKSDGTVISHRKGTYIKQGLIGNVVGYPCTWFGADAWDAYKIDENGYYFDTAGEHMDMLPQIENNPHGGYIDLDKVRDFVSDGRQETVKNILWFLLHEFEKPEKERKVVIIKDLPENVELWVSAIEYSLSVDMAKKITFSTNKTNIGMQADSKLFYYTDQRGNYVSTQNNSVSQKRHPCNMIVGIHPKDSSCSTLRATPVSNFVVVDGSAKTSGIKSDDSINREYYSDVVCFEESIVIFCQELFPKLGVAEIGTHIVDIYDACKYLGENPLDKWEYKKTLDYYEILSRYKDHTSKTIKQYLIDHGLIVYPRLAEDDGKNNFKLFKLIAGIGGESGSKESMAEYFYNMLSDELSEINDPECNLAQVWNSIKAAHIQDIIKPAICKIFSQSSLRAYKEPIETAPKDAVEALLDMYIFSAGYNMAPLEAMNNEKGYIVVWCVFALIDDDEMLKKSFRLLENHPKLFFKVSTVIGSQLKTVDPARLRTWWDYVISFSGDNVSELCKRICDQHLASIDTIEEILANRIKREQKCDRYIISSFGEAVNKLGITEHTGEVFYNAWLQVSKPEKIAEVINSIKKSDITPNAKRNLFYYIESMATLNNIDTFKQDFFSELNSFGKSIDCFSIVNALYNLKSSMKQVRNSSDAMQLLTGFARRSIPLPNDMIDSEYFNYIASSIGKFNSKDLNVVFMGLFKIDNLDTLQKYSDSYVKKLLEGKSGKNLAQAMLSVCEVSATKYKALGQADPDTDNIKTVFNKSLKKLLPNYYKPNLLGYVERASDVDETAKANLIALLKGADSGSGNNNGGFSGLISNIFRKK